MDKKTMAMRAGITLFLTVVTAAILLMYMGGPGHFCYMLFSEVPCELQWPLFVGIMLMDLILNYALAFAFTREKR